MNAARICAGLALAVLAFFAVRDVLRLDDAAPWRKMFDFVDFYCAGSALDHGADPYRYEPLRACEHANSANLPMFAASPALAVPAPQPPYDLAVYRFVSRLPFDTARTLDAIATLLVLLVCAGALFAAGLPFDVAFVALLLPVGYVEFGSGQVAPFSFAAMVMCGTALVKRRDAVAGVFGGLIAIEPHVALPVCLALLFFVPRARVALVVTLAALAALSVATVGFHGVAEYALAVLPAHAFAEAANPQQFSATYALWFLGVPVTAALLLGNVSYAIVAVAGVVLAGRRKNATGLERALLAYLPAALAILGGSFIHIEEIPFAVPAALVLTSGFTGIARNVAAAALCVLIVPWTLVWSIKRLLAIALLSCAVLLTRLRIGAVAALVTLGSIAVVAFAFEHYPPDLHIALPATAHYAADALVQTEWTDLMAGLTTHDPLWFAIKLPVWLALAAVAVLAALAPYREYSHDA